MKKENFKNALEWLYATNKVKDQSDLSRQTGVTETSISRILNGWVKQPSEKTLRKINAAFGGIFNMDYLRGKSDVMFADVQHNQLPAQQPPVSYGQIDESSKINAIIASHSVAIEAYKQLLADKDKRLAEKDDHIKTLESYIADLRSMLALKGNENELKKFPFPTGVADDGDNPRPTTR